jgi:hypothetical protein
MWVLNDLHFEGDNSSNLGGEKLSASYLGGGIHISLRY